MNKRYPVHFDLLCKELLPRVGRQKVSVKVKNAVEFYLEELGDEIVRKGDFIFPTDYSEIPVYGETGRVIQQISTEEIAEAIYQVASKRTGMTEEALCGEAMKALGFSRMTSQVTTEMQQAFQSLLTNNRIELLDEKVRLL